MRGVEEVEDGSGDEAGCGHATRKPRNTRPARNGRAICSKSHAAIVAPSFRTRQSARGS
jgi:hypothetical protein